MSAERNYRCHVKDYYAGLTATGEVDLPGLATKLGFTPDKMAKLNLDEKRLRAAISMALGKIEEETHKTFIDDTSGRRVHSPPESINIHHNRLVDELYHYLTPPESAAD